MGCGRRTGSAKPSLPEAFDSLESALRAFRLPGADADWSALAARVCVQEARGRLGLDSDDAGLTDLARSEFAYTAVSASR